VTSPQPQFVDASAVAARARDLGAQWSLTGERELDANVVHIPACDGIADHASGVDVVMVGIAGEGTVIVDGQAMALRPGVLTFVPRDLVRSVRAGGSALSYLTVHRRRNKGLTVGRTRVGGRGD
jgi:quercetin dioxygenase-like cupin family protein